MAKKLLGIVAVIITAGLYLVNIPFISANTTTCVNGKSSGQFVNFPAFYDNDGYSVVLDSETQAVNFLNSYKCELVYIESVNGIQNYYFFSQNLAKKQVLNGKTVNVHLAVNGERIILGYPLIYGSY